MRTIPHPCISPKDVRWTILYELEESDEGYSTSMYTCISPQVAVSLLKITMMAKQKPEVKVNFQVCCFFLLFAGGAFYHRRVKVAIKGDNPLKLLTR